MWSSDWAEVYEPADTPFDTAFMTPSSVRDKWLARGIADSLAFSAERRFSSARPGSAHHC
jgi:hypothetical protein